MAGFDLDSLGEIADGEDAAGDAGAVAELEAISVDMDDVVLASDDAAYDVLLYVHRAADVSLNILVQPVSSTPARTIFAVPPSVISRRAADRLVPANFYDRALSAAVDDELRKLAGILSQRQTRLPAEAARGGAALGPSAYGGTDQGGDEEIRVDEGAEEVGAANGSERLLARAVSRRPQAEGATERAMQLVSVGTHSVHGTVTTNNGATALRAMRKTLIDYPEAIISVVHALMREDIKEGSLPVSDTDPPDPHFWLEHRSKVTGHRSNVNYAWILAFIVKALEGGRPREALARSLLGLVAADQVSLNKGSWLMAWPLQFQQKEPPYASFDAHTTTSSTLPHSSIADPRWVTMIQAWHRELDDIIERQKRLESRTLRQAQRQNDEVDDTTGAAAEPRVRGEGARKAEERQARGERAARENLGRDLSGAEWCALP